MEHLHLNFSKISGQINPMLSYTEICKALKIIPNPDGTFTREPLYPDIPATSESDQPIPVLSKDITIDQANNTWARLYLPREAIASSSANKSLPLIVYIHGGGFLLLSVASSLNHDFCSKMALQLPAIVVSIEYRLAPEHRLPAAYDDSVQVFHWITTTKEGWLREYADYNNCFIMGSSAGGNITYHAGLRLAEEAVQQLIEPLEIKGLILNQPFYGGIQRTQSELRLVSDPFLSTSVTDFLWEFSLPAGADRDHEYSNPLARGGSKLLDIIKSLGWKIMVTGCDGDPLIDRQREMVKFMEDEGIKVEGRFTGGGHHGEDMMQPSKTNELLMAVKRFIE